ncbi:hypothetical protein [Algoriphagus sp. A40]|uniref:hypothetical protein n=1 Tax=Algoriphagus sp. A40 TaxID=1945863 RepID=UPI00098582D7|nr:hypothetical protein [Algoriphagus sp. A40]OOG74813.1 hypothetical protein B0E43_10525 [Algoriphagus sp. A40]
MKKQKIALLLSLSWLIGLIAIFSFPPSIKSAAEPHSQHSELREITAPDLVLRASGQTPEVPAFKADLHFSDLLSANSKTDFVPSITQYLSPSFFTKSRPLFDVLITFFYFFHTW